MAFRAKFKSGVTTKKIVKMLLVTIIALYVGGQLLDQFGAAMLNTCSPFYKGFSLIGWTTNSSNCITAAASGGVLSVVGIVALAAVVTSVVHIRF